MDQGQETDQTEEEKLGKAKGYLAAYLIGWVSLLSGTYLMFKDIDFLARQPTPGPFFKTLLGFIIFLIIAIVIIRRSMTALNWYFQTEKNNPQFINARRLMFVIFSAVGVLGLVLASHPKLFFSGHEEVQPRTVSSDPSDRGETFQQHLEEARALKKERARAKKADL
jgi:hypothetical protein